MEELPDEVTLLVLAHIDPLRDAAAVSGTCRKWRRLMLDPHLWKGFFNRTFPTQLQVEEEKEGAPSSGSTTRRQPWRHRYLKKAWHLKWLLENPPGGERGNAGRLLAAALVGCLPLAKRQVARLVAAHGGDPVVLSTLTYKPDGDGETTSLLRECLRRACRAGSVPLAKLFIEQGAEVGKKCMLAAVQSGNPQLVSFVLDRAVRYKIMLHIFAVLESAAARGNVDTLKLLLELGVVPLNNKAIAQAAGSGRLEAVKLLLDRGFYYPEEDEDTIDCAVQSGNAAIVQLLQQHGATLQGRHLITALNRDESPSTEMLQLLAPALCPGVWRECLTSRALQRGDVAVCRFLVSHGVDLDLTFDSGCDLGQCTALHHAVLYNYAEMARCLLECGARVDVKAKGMRMTALSLARQYTHTGSSWVILKHRPGKRKRKSTSEVEKKKKKNENEDENEEEKGKNEDEADGDDDTTKPARKKQKQKEPSPEKREEKELEAKVRPLAKLEGHVKLDVFTLRQMLRRWGVLAGDLPKRKLPLLRLAVDWLSAGN